MSVRDVSSPVCIAFWQWSLNARVDLQFKSSSETRVRLCITSHSNLQNWRIVRSALVDPSKMKLLANATRNYNFHTSCFFLHILLLFFSFGLIILLYF